jgi:DNA-3-methyladenine glycosylase I
MRRCGWVPERDLLYVAYHDEEWGVPSHDDRHLFELLVLEGAQAGLSWSTILNKREAFREVFAGFDADVVASYDEGDVERLMAEPRIVRNRRKIEAAIANARATVALRARGGLEDLIWSFRPATTPAPTHTGEMVTTSPESLALSKALKRAGFAHVGPTTMYALMEAVGIVDDHLVGCHRRGASGVWG